MESLYLLVPIALLFAAAIIGLLVWAINQGQYDDLDKDAWRALNDDPTRPTAGQNDDEPN